MEQAIQLVSNALNTANMKGVFTLQDSVNIANALNVIIENYNQSKSAKQDPEVKNLKSK